mmetsp:Transcript_1880/g.3727  ORF Transcript_1880/g.3727 Transcript_1880/m.3727 type:complete len:122 (+) Transcript_1880:458-823(+)
MLVALEERYRDTGDIDFAPDSIIYGTVLNAWGNAGGRDAAGRAESLLRRMVEQYEDGNDAVKPDVVAYTLCMRAWSSSDTASGESSGVERAEAILTKHGGTVQTDGGLGYQAGCDCIQYRD